MQQLNRGHGIEVPDRSNALARRLSDGDKIYVVKTNHSFTLAVEDGVDHDSLIYREKQSEKRKVVVVMVNNDLSYLGLWQMRNMVTVHSRMVVLERLVLCS